MQTEIEIRYTCEAGYSWWTPLKLAFYTGRAKYCNGELVSREVSYMEGNWFPKRVYKFFSPENVRTMEIKYEVH